MLKLTIAILAATLLTACGGPGKKAEKQPEKTVMCGGYNQQRPLSDAERTLFRQVTDTLTGVSYTPESVATQVVAGTNYRFICRAKSATPDPAAYKAEVVVYKPLPGQGEAKITKITRL